MKKLIVCLLALALCMGLCPFALGDGEGEQVDLTPENWSEYLVVAPKYEGKLKDVDITGIQGTVTFKPEPTAEGAVEVPITLENWEQFFEIKTYRKEQTDAFGDPDIAIVTHYIDVREPYADYLVTELKNHVAFMFNYDYVIHSIWVGNTCYGSPKEAAAQLQEGDKYRVSEEDVSPEQCSVLFETQGMGGYDEVALCYERSVPNFDSVEEYFAPEDRYMPIDEPTNFTATRVEGSIFLSGIDPDAVPETPAEEPAADFTPVAAGDVLTLDFAKITVGTPTYAQEIREGGSISYTRPAQTQGNVIYWLPLTLQNTTGSGYKLSGWRTKAELVFDGTYTYEGKMENLYGGSAKTMDPLVDNNIYVYAEVPQSLAESAQSVTIRFGFNEGFAEYDPFAGTLDTLDCRYAYIVGEPVADAASAAADSAVPLALGDTIETDFMTMTLGSVHIEDEIYPEDTSGVYLYIQDMADSQYIYLTGRMLNLAGENLDGRYFDGQITVNGTYTYDAELSIASNPAATTDYALAPLQEATYYLYAAVPDAAVERLEEGAVALRFNDLFARETNGYAYSYTVPFTP